jgi:flavin-binding protein dodecin
MKTLLGELAVRGFFHGDDCLTLPSRQNGAFFVFGFGSGQYFRVRGDTMAVIKVIELVGTSKTSWEDAAQQVVTEASETLRNISGIDLVRHTAQVENGRISEYRSTVHVAFVVEHHSHIVGAGASE